MQEAVVLINSIKEAQLNSQIENIKDKLGTIFKACGKTTKDKADKIDETKLPKLSAEEVIRINLPTISTLWELIATIPKLDFKVINLLNKLIFAAQYTSKPINDINIDIKSNNFPNQNKNSKYFAFFTLVN